MIGRLVLTGASSGIGAALAAEFAAPGVSMLLIARRADQLEAVAAAARAKGAEVTIAALDVTDAAGLRAALRAYDAAAPVDLVLANAGVAKGGLPEPEGQARAVIETNLIGAVNTVEPLLPAMIARGAGRIGLVSSISALRPSADLVSYSAAKAGVRAYAQALRSGLRAKGVAVSVIIPGFVTSPMSAKHHGPKPFEIPAERAARIIRRGLERRRSAIVFPIPFALMVFGGNLLGPRLSDWFERRYAARIGDG